MAIIKNSHSSWIDFLRLKYLTQFNHWPTEETGVADMLDIERVNNNPTYLSYIGHCHSVEKDKTKDIDPVAECLKIMEWRD